MSSLREHSSDRFVLLELQNKRMEGEKKGVKKKSQLQLFQVQQKKAVSNKTLLQFIPKYPA